MKKLSVLLILMLLLVACGGSERNAPPNRSGGEEMAATEETASEEKSEEVAEGASDEASGEGTEQASDESNAMAAEEVEIMLVDALDGILNNYCLDIAGGNQNVDPANGLQAHTCYSYRGELGTDQVFDTGRLADNVLYMPVYDVCVQIASLEAGAEVGLAACDGNDLQNIVYSGSGTINPASAPELCFTANADSRMGRGSQHQIRDLSLELCSDDLAAFQQWATNSTTSAAERPATEESVADSDIAADNDTDAAADISNEEAAEAGDGEEQDGSGEALPPPDDNGGSGEPGAEEAHAGERGPGEGGGPGGPPDLAGAAETLGVTEQALMDALGGPPPDFTAAAETLGISEEELREVVGGPGGGGPGGGGPGGGPGGGEAQTESVPSEPDLSNCDTANVADQSTDENVEALRQAMVAFRSSLDEALVGEASNCLGSTRFYLWHNTPANNGNRDGITYGDLSDEQVALFQALLQGFLSDDGYKKVDEITLVAEAYLNTLMPNVWNPEFYSIDMFGDPENTGSWGFQLDGHHAAMSFLVHGDAVSMVPAFLGAEPERITYEGIDYDIFAAERDLAIALYSGLSADENEAAVSTYDGESLVVGPANRNGNPDPYIGEYDYSQFTTGLKYADMSEATQANLTALMQVFVYNLESPFADVWWEDIMANIDDTYFVWLGNEEILTVSSQFYFRIYNPVVWIEYNVEDITGGSSNSEGEGHAHQITRIPSTYNGGDYGIFANVINNGGPSTLLEHYAMVDHHALSHVHFDYVLAAQVSHTHN